MELYDSETQDLVAVIEMFDEGASSVEIKNPNPTPIILSRIRPDNRHVPATPLHDAHPGGPLLRPGAQQGSDVCRFRFSVCRKFSLNAQAF
jgi:hypothetical protein